MKRIESISTPPQSTCEFTFDLQRFDDLTLTQDGGNYLIGSVADLQTLADFVNGGGDTSGKTFKLTANISGVDFHIGTSDSKFKGTFDGGSCKITVNYNTDQDNCALFNYVDGATIKNLTVDGTINTSAKYAAGFVAQTAGTVYIIDSKSSVTINSTIEGDGTHGGFIGVANAATVITRSVFNGSLLGESTTSCGGFVGYRKRGVLNINECLFSPTAISIGTEDSATFARNGVSHFYDASYYTQAFNDTQGGVQVCKFNGSLPEGVTTSDTRTLDGTNYIKATGTLRYNGKNYVYNVNQDTTITVEDGKLYVNGTELELDFIETAEMDSDGYYLIGTLKQLQNFAAYVNRGNNCDGKKFKLTADITLPEVEEGQSNWTAITSFKGEFNGDNHTIDNMTIRTTDDCQGGLFKTLDVGGKVLNLNLTNVDISGNSNYCGGIAVNNDGVIKYCNVTVSIQGTSGLGGIAYKNEGTIDYCNVIGSIQGTTSGLGGIAGSNLGTIAHCFADVEIKGELGGALVCHQSNNANNVYSNSYHSDNAVSGNNIDSFDITNVKYYRLNLPEGVTASGDGVIEKFGNYYFRWAGSTVTLSEPVGNITTFTTVAEDMTIAASIDLTGDGSADNPYQIATAEDLQTLATYVNTGNTCEGKYFKVTAENGIDMSGINFAGIGNETTAFKGTFDGYGNTISNLTINKAGGCRLGLFGYVDGATIQNVNLTGVNITAFGTLGAVVGRAKSSTIKNVTATGSISGKNDAGVYVGGLVGILDTGTYNTITNCKADVAVSGKEAFALFGDLDPSYVVINNCYYRGVEHGLITGITPIYKLTIPDDLTAGGNLVEFGGNTYAAAGTQITLTIANSDGFHKVTGISNATADGDNYTCTVGTSDVEFKLEGFPKIGNLAFDGTNTYSISDEAGLRALANFVNAGNNCAGMKFKVTQDITLSGTWTPIGNQSNRFKGTFDGGNSDNFTISNLTINTPSKSYLGLFSYVDGGTVKNVTLVNANIKGNSYVGGLVGYNNGGTVENCFVDANVAGNGEFGGLVGHKWSNANVNNNTFHSNANAVGSGGGSNNTRVYLLTLNGVEVSGGETVNIKGTNYYKGGEVTATTKTGYVVDSSITIDSDKTITATFDSANHYVLANDTSTLATVDNTKDYPDLVQVYKLTLPDGVTATGDKVSIGGVNYYRGTITLNAAEGYTLSNITVNGNSSGNTFTINGDANITADITAIIEENNIFNAAGTGVTVNGTKGDFHANSTLYSITASQQNSTLIANAKNNTVIIHGGGENILTGGTGNDTFKFSAGGGIVTDYGIGATKNGSGQATTANGVDIVKVDGKVTGIYFDRNANTKKSATFTATIVYGNDNEVIVLKDIVKKPTKTGSSPIYQTNDIAAATLKIWDTSGSKQAVLSAAKLKKLFKDDDYLSNEQKDKVAELSELVQPANIITTSGGESTFTNPLTTPLALNSNRPKD